MSVNKVMILGNLGRDPDSAYTDSGVARCKFPVATSESYTDRNGNTNEKTTWHQVVVWSNRAEACAKYLSKGRKVFVEGKLQTRTWEDEQGKTNYVTEIVASSVVFLSNVSSDDKTNNQDNMPKEPIASQEVTKPVSLEKENFAEEDIPF